MPSDVHAPLIGAPGMTLTESVRRTLLDIIIRGQYEHGHRLYPERIADQFGVSVTPVREALMQLASEGFIETVHRRGFHVRTPSSLHLKELWQVRQGLEITAGELCIERLKLCEIDNGDLEGLAELQRAQEDTEILASHVQKLELNNKFHCRIFELGGNQMLIDLYEGTQVKVAAALVQRGLDTWRTRLADESAEHWALINALRGREFSAFRHAVQTHLARSLRDALTDLAAQDSPEKPEIPGQNSINRRSNAS